MDINPLMQWVADFRGISHFTLFPFPSLKNLAEGSLEGHLVQFPTQETVVSTCLRLLWLCLNNCMEFSFFQTKDTCSRAALLPLSKNVLPNVRHKPARSQPTAIVPFSI